MYKKYVKRIIDIIVSIVVLIVFSPLYLLIGILVKVIDGGKIIYKQYRTGKDGKNFEIYKFKTIKNGKITKLGRFLRITSLDEIPQFYNVLKGDMSIIGPRPWTPEFYNNFTDDQKERANVTPGLVGLAQVNGRRGINVLDKINYDIKYVRKLSLWLDLKILIKSVKVIINIRNINETESYMNSEIEMLKNQKR